MGNWIAMRSCKAWNRDMSVELRAQRKFYLGSLGDSSAEDRSGGLTCPCGPEGMTEARRGCSCLAVGKQHSKLRDEGKKGGPTPTSNTPQYRKATSRRRACPNFSGQAQ